MRKEYNKLVRDRIPEIIHADGLSLETRVLPEQEYNRALLAKLVEEANEAAVASSADLPKELADVYEVLDAILSTVGLDPGTVRELQNQRRLERGGFQERLLLLWTE